MSNVLAIDPGTHESAWIELENGNPSGFAIERNEVLVMNLSEMTCGGALPMAIEMIASYGMPVGAEVFETCVWIGRFIEAANAPHTKVYRKDVKMHLCGTSRAKDANIRQALIDKYGGSKEAAIGRKATPGPLYGVKSHLWAALAVGVTYLESDHRSV